jgi:hypothetical protein
MTHVQYFEYLYRTGIRELSDLIKDPKFLNFKLRHPYNYDDFIKVKIENNKLIVNFDNKSLILDRDIIKNTNLLFYFDIRGF